MSAKATRRNFLRASAIGGLLGTADLGWLNRLPAVSASDTRLDPNVVRLSPEIEPLVRFLEETPRHRLLEETAAKVRHGLSYRELLAALLLAGVRNVEPRPSVGFKFHAVLVVNAAHLASMAAPDADRWLPIFWALDNFKESQARNQKERHGWRMAPVKESAVPPARRARRAFIDALEKWDVEAADAAIAGLVRTAGADEVFEVFWKYAPRDYRSIGHKIIFASHARRVLGCIGWHHAEPVLRSLAYALLAHEGSDPLKSDSRVDRPGRKNRELARQVRPDWLEGKTDSAATTDLLTTLRHASPDEASQAVVKLLNRGVAAQSVWDALLLGSGELLMRKPEVVSLHTLTTANAIRFAFDTCADDETRRWLLLQNASFLPFFRADLERRGKLAELRVDTFEPEPAKATGAEAVGEVFADLGRKDRLSAARKTLAYLQGGGGVPALADAARLLVFLKGTDAHDYKFSSAVLEDYRHLSPTWRDRYLAASVYWLRGSGGPDSGVAKRTRAALTG